jgi:hypothetical protein
MIQLLKGSKTRIFPYIVHIGAGANGGYILQQTAQMMNIFGVKGFYLVADPDRIESKNLKNQLFIPKDLGLTKASVLAKRYRTHYEVSLASYDEGYVKTANDLHRLFQYTDYQDAFHYDSLFLPILIGAVDNAFSRKVMHHYFMSQDKLLYIDVGVESAWIPSHGHPKADWTKDEVERHKKTGYTGQVVVGLRMDGKNILDPIASDSPDILTDEDQVAPSEMSCSDVIASEPQRLITNRFAGLTVAGYLNELFDTATITNHKTYFHAKKQYMRAERVPQNEESL